MKNNYEKIRLVSSVADVRDLVQSKSLILVDGWKKPVSASFIGCMLEGYMIELIESGKMHLVAKHPIAGGNNKPKLVRRDGKLYTSGGFLASKERENHLQDAMEYSLGEPLKDSQGRSVSKDRQSFGFGEPLKATDDRVMKRVGLKNENGEVGSKFTFCEVEVDDTIDTLKEKMKSPKPLTMSEAVGRTDEAWKDLEKWSNNVIQRNRVWLENTPINVEEAGKKINKALLKATMDTRKTQPSLLQRFLNWCKS